MAKRSVPIFCFLFIFSVSSFAQWKSYDQHNSPFKSNTHIALLCADQEDELVCVFTFDTAFHFFEYREASGWVNHPEFDALLRTAIHITDAKIRNGVLWCTSTFGLKKYENGIWTHYAYPAQVQGSVQGIYIASNGDVWFAGGLFGKGITRFNGTTWTHIDKNQHPEFLQDEWVVDLEMDEENNIIWLGTNCASQNAGVYKYDIAADKITYINNGDPKYGCVHGVQPYGGKVFVGTSNFSSIRLMENNIYTQSLDNPKVSWVTDIVIDPLDDNRVWVMNEFGITHFADTNHYVYLDTNQIPAKGIGTKLAIQKKDADSSILWMGTNSGLFSYQYGRTQTYTGKDRTQLISLYPNPSKETITVGSEWRVQNYVIYDIAGRVMQQGFYKGHIIIENLQEGMYILRTTLENGQVSYGKFLKSN